MRSPAEQRHESLLYTPFTEGGPYLSTEAPKEITFEEVMRMLNPDDPDVYTEYADWLDTGGEA